MSRNPEVQPCEVFARVVGYVRPVKNFNAGKQEEFKDRKIINSFADYSM